MCVYIFHIAPQNLSRLIYCKDKEFLNCHLTEVGVYHRIPFIIHIVQLLLCQIYVSATLIRNPEVQNRIVNKQLLLRNKIEHNFISIFFYILKTGNFTGEHLFLFIDKVYTYMNTLTIQMTRSKSRFFD